MNTVLAIPKRDWDALKSGKLSDSSDPDFSDWDWTPETEMVAVKVRDIVKELEKTHSVPTKASV